MAPSIAARRVDGVQGASCPKGSAERWQRCLSREPVLSKAICRPTRSAEGTGGHAAPRRYVPRSTRTSTFSYRSIMIIRCFKRKRAHSDAPGSSWTRRRCVLKTPPRAQPWLLCDAAAPEPHLAPHKKEPSPAQETNRSSVSQGRWTKRRRAATTTPPKRASTSKIR